MVIFAPLKLTIKNTFIKKLLLFMLLSSAFSANAQFGIDLIAKGISNSKNAKLVKENLTTEVYNGDTLFIVRVPNDKIKSKAKSYIVEVQNKLEAIKKQLYNNEDMDISINFKYEIRSIQGYDADWNVEYYEKELKAYEVIKAKRIAKAKRDAAIKDSIQKEERRVADSIQKEEKIKRDKEKAAQKIIDDSIKKVNFPYYLAAEDLDARYSHRMMTVFCGIDANFANERISNFFKERMSLLPTNYSVNGNVITQRFRYNTSKEGATDLTIKYYVKKTKNKPYKKTTDGLCPVITKCEILFGTNLNSAVNFTAFYWNRTFDMYGGNKLGDVGSFVYMGDDIKLSIVNITTYQITITPNASTTEDYYKKYEIN